MKRKIVPDIVQPTNVAAAEVSDTVAAAAKVMRDRKIAALVINDEAGGLAGIITERDIVFRAVAGGLDTATVTVGEIMTANPDTLSPDDIAADALELMQTRGYRHLPVLDGGKCVAVVSIRDLFKSVKASLEESIRETEAFVFGDRYGA